MIEKNWDVIVVGGGPSGITAAISSARLGATTLLIERYGFLGGMATAGLVGPFMSSFAGDEQVVIGLFEEIIQNLIVRDGAIGHIKCPYSENTTFGTGGYITPFCPEQLKLVAEQMVLSTGTQVLYHSLVTGVSCNDGRLQAIEVQNKSGTNIFKARCFVDATGDGDVAFMSGAQFEKGRPGDGLMQGMTLFFRMEGVDLALIKQYMQQNPEQFAWMTFPQAPRRKGLQDVWVAGSGFLDLVKKGIGDGKLQLGRDRITFFSGLRKGEILLNATRVNGDGTDAVRLTNAEIEGRRQVSSLGAFLRTQVPGFERAYITRIAPQIGVRETRRIIGYYVLTSEDLLKGRQFYDVVCRGAYPIDIHEPGGKGDDWIEPRPGMAYNIPLRSIIPRDIDNLLVAGRCISVTHEALGATRVMPNCMAIGQAAGTTAALVALNNILPKDLEVSLVQKRLLEQEVSLGQKCG